MTLVMLTGVFQIPPLPVDAGDGQSTNFSSEEPVTNGNWVEDLEPPPFEMPEKGNPKLDSALNKLVAGKSVPPADPGAPLVESVPSENVRVIIESKPGMAEAVSAAAAAFGTVEGSYQDLVQVFVPVSQLTALAEMETIRFIREPMRPLPAATSQGVGLINANDWQTISYNGTGVKVGILDTGFYGYTNLLGSDLPATVTAQTFLEPGEGDINGLTGYPENHGTACAEIVYDVAPGATFYLANFNTEVEFASAVTWLTGQGVKVISCSVGLPLGGPGDGTGTICDVIKTARSNGVLWVQAAGNQAQMHWQGNWSDTDTDGFLNFSGVDEGNTISVSSSDYIVVVLRWDDTWGVSSNDYDLRLYDKNGTLVYWSDYEQNGDDDPLEGIVYAATYDGIYNIAITKWGSPAPVNFHLFSYYHGLEYQTASGSLLVPADSPDALTTGAVYYGTPDTLESYSSRGPTVDSRIKPDLVAPDGVSNVSLNPFYGTSASTPHVAGAAALVKQIFPAYNPDQIQTYLESLAKDLGTTGKDNLYGSGRLDLGNRLEISPSNNGSTTPTSGNHTYKSGALVSLTAIPDAGYMLHNWIGDISTIADVNDPTTTITMNDFYTISANFTKPVLTMATTIGGDVNPAVGPHEYNYGVSVNITATPNPGHMFREWTGDTSTVADTSSNETTVIMNGDYTITANFTGPRLTMSVIGSGNVTPSAGIHYYDIDDVVDISANASLKWVFTNWAGEVSTVDNVSFSSTNITMDNDYSISANFTRTHGTVTLAVSGNGTASMSPVSDNNSTYAIETLVSVNATAGQGWRFAGWTGDIQDLDDNSSASTNMTINNDYTITANFTRPVLTMAVSGSGSVTPAAGTHEYNLGSTINITATPASGCRFVNWTGNVGTVANVNSASTNVTINNDYTITANFAVIPQDPGGGGPGGGGGGGSSGGVNGKTTTSLRGSSSSTGVVWANIQAVSMDTKCKLDIPYGTKCTNANGNALTSVTITELSQPDAVQNGVTLVGTVYELGPRGAGFNPPIILTIEYDEDNLPSGTPESALNIAIWDTESKTYKKIDCQINTETNKIIASISHFSRYTIISAPRPASFTLSGLSVSPASVKPGDTVNVSVTVSNSGDISGDYTCSVSVNGVTKASKKVAVSANSQTSVSFSIISEGSGQCSISVGSLSGSFSVITSPASFKASVLTISPAEVEIGGKATVSVTITNEGQTSGTYQVKLNIDGKTADTKEVSLSGGASEKVSFTVTGNTAGKAMIDINALIGSLLVLEAKTTPTTTQPVSTTPAVATPTKVTTSTPVTPPSGISWGLIAGIIACVVVVAAGCVLYFAWWRKR